MKLIYIILDGAGDRPCKELGGKTPFESAKKPNLDKLASLSRCGLIYPIAKGIAPESDTAVLSLLGYSVKNYCGRGPLEALGSGLALKKGELALRANFATIENGSITERRAGRTLTSKEGGVLAKFINQNLKLENAEFIFRQTIEHRGVLILKSKQKLSENISNTDSGYVKKKGLSIAQSKISRGLKKCVPLDNSKPAKFTAEIINEFTEKTSELLKNHPVNLRRKAKGLLPANAILLRDAGAKMPEFAKIKYKWAAAVGMPLEKGIAEAAGMKILEVKYPELKSSDVYAHLFEELSAEIKTAREVIESEKIKKYDAVYFHFKETDIPGHDGFPDKKKKMIETIDRDFFSVLLKKINLNNTIICVTSDHCTPCGLKAHASDPVPALVYIPYEQSDNIIRFGEKYCKKGSLKMNGSQLFKYLISRVK